MSAFDFNLVHKCIYQITLALLLDTNYKFVVCWKVENQEPDSQILYNEVSLKYV